jgi:hypothetical protein
MKTTTKKQATSKKQTPPKPYHPAFGTIGRDVDLGIGILIAEGATGQYEILGPVATIDEAIEIARHDSASRLDALEHLGDPMCPEVYTYLGRACQFARVRLRGPKVRQKTSEGKRRRVLRVGREPNGIQAGGRSTTKWCLAA